MAEGHRLKRTISQKELYKKVLKNKKDFLLENLTDVDGILDRLNRDEIIVEITYRDIKDTLKNKTTTEAIRMLLEDVVSICEHYIAFKKILKEMKMEFLVVELDKEEEFLAAQLDETSISKQLEDLTLQDYTEESHYDLCILYEDIDIEVAEEIKTYLKELDRNSDSPVSILLLDDENVFLSASKAEKLRQIARISTLQLYIVPICGDKDPDVRWMTDSLTTKDLDEGKLMIRKVLCERNSKSKDVALSESQDIKWYDKQKDHFKLKMKLLIDSLKKKRQSKTKNTNVKAL